MADMWLLKYPLFLLLWARGVHCGSINMKGSGVYTVLGREFTFTCEVFNASVGGIFLFRRGYNHSFQSVCGVAVDEGEKKTGKNRTQCSDEDGQRHTYTLTIRDVSRKDSTVWQCQGGGMASNNVTLDVRSPPKVEIKAVKPCSGFTFLVDESNVSLNCTVKRANPAPTNFTWYHGDVVLKSGADQIYTLDRVTRSSPGQYRCTADNGISPPGQANVTVTVHYPPILHLDTTKRVVKESDDLTILCTAEANPEVTSIVWTKDGLGETTSGNGTLHLKNITRSKAGAYICTATNKVTTCNGTEQKNNSSTVTVEVQYPPTVAIHVVKPCSGFTFLVNESKVVLNCTVKGGNPAPTNFTWYHEDVQLKRGADQIYTIDRVTRSSQGQYRCTADNGISPPGQANVAVTVHYPPIVNINGTKRLVNESDDLTINCTAEAHPEVTSIVWTRDGEGGIISHNGTLGLKNIQKTGAGKYVCTATNDVTTCHGTEQKKTNSSTVTVEVQYVPDILSFGVTSGDRTVTLTEHDNVTLQCNISSNPASTIEIGNKTSSIGGRKISNYNQVRSGSYKQTMKAMLLDVSCQEGGEYTCSAGNLIGKAAPQTVLLQVTCAPRRSSSSSDNLVFASNLHENATLSLTVIAFPPPTFEWKKKPNARPINTTEVSTEGVLVTGSVTILDVKEEDLLNYTVNVKNTEGELEVKIALVSKSRPYKPSNLKAANIHPRSVTLKWEKAFNGGATQMFNIQYRQHGGQWTTHPSRPSEDDALQLDIDYLEPGTLYEIRMNALNDYGNSSYVSITVTTATDPDNSSTTVGVVAAVVVIGVMTIIAVIIVKKRKNKHKGQDASMADQREWDDARVVANNDLYETSADLDIHPSGPGAGVDANDVYAVVNKPAKTINPHEDIYAQPKKKKGQTKEKRKEKKKVVANNDLYETSADLDIHPSGPGAGVDANDIYAVVNKPAKTNTDIVSPALGAGGEGSGAELKEGQKTGIDEDGLLYVSVDFSGRPQASNVIIRSEEETEYSGIDFVASAVRKE